MVPGSYFGFATFTRGGCTNPDDYEFLLDFPISPNIQDVVDKITSSLPPSTSIGCSTPSYLFINRIICI